MPYEPLKCKNCEAALKYDAIMKLWFCDHCGYFSTKEIPINYYTTNISDLYLDGVHFDTEITVEMKMKLNAAEASITLGKFEDALNRFQTLADVIPHEYRVWWGQIRAKTQDLTAEIGNKDDINSLCSLYDAMMHFVPEPKRYEIEQKFLAYIQMQEERLDERFRQLQSKERTLREELDDVRADLMECRSAVYESSDQAIKIAEIVLAAALILGVLGKSIILFLAAIAGIGYYCLVFEPEMKQQKENWEYQKQKRMEELAHQGENIEQELKEISDALKELET